MVDVPRAVQPQPRKVAESQTTLVQLMGITHANVAGIVHGGEIMKLVDTAAGIAAIKHASGMCVTVSIDEMSFLHPVHVGDLVTVKASVNDVGTTSLEVGVRVEVEDVMSGEQKHTSSAYLVFVALDDEGKPRPVPDVTPEGASQKRRQREAKIRREMRLAHREAIATHRAQDEAIRARERRPAIPMSPEEDTGGPPHLRM
jgi:acyl-CoA hydrolase